MIQTFGFMQQAFEAAKLSPHPVNKIAAVLTGQRLDGSPYAIVRTNRTPREILARLGGNARIGGASDTVHAETSALLDAEITAGSRLYITEPSCPNCAKHAAECGVDSVLIDSHGFEKDWARRRIDDFERLSLRIFEDAGVAVYKVDRERESLHPLVADPSRNAGYERDPVTVEPLGKRPEHEGFHALIERCRKKHSGLFAVAIARNGAGASFGMTAVPRLSVADSFFRASGWDARRDKYSPVIEPVTRLLMNAGRYGLTIADGLLYASQVPTARELVNLAGANLRTIGIGRADKAADENDLSAWRTMQEAGILNRAGLPGPLYR